MGPAASRPELPDHQGIAALIPHQGRMCLLDRVLHCTPHEIRCTAVSHRLPQHPLRSDDGLLAPCAIEYAAQAMALHGALNTPPGQRQRPGFLASARQVRLHVPRLDDVPSPLLVHAQLLAGDARQALYRFELRDEAGRCLVDGRAAVVLDSAGTAS